MNWRPRNAPALDISGHRRPLPASLRERGTTRVMIESRSGTVSQFEGSVVSFNAIRYDTSVLFPSGSLAVHANVTAVNVVSGCLSTLVGSFGFCRRQRRAANS